MKLVILSHTACFSCHVFVAFPGPIFCARWSGKVYGLALDGMLKNLEHAKAVSSHLPHSKTDSLCEEVW